ncbi:hypothetical protein [Azospirillum sp. SYSU D00513]|uniref:hypothetical protein n=1 Tax=Azospirillum sp. SYSU D00513 TaxID=2812561 RepID=UPI001A96B1C8|nr:hypothetical protein [Azospirillum sp. SYSU D00513]
MSVPFRIAVLALALATAACSERVVSDLPAPAYTQGEVAYAAADRDLRVVVHGNPFPMNQQAFGRLVTDSMQNRIFGVRTNFTTTPNETARRDYRVVLAFNPTENLLNSSLCGMPTIPTAPPGGPIVVQGAFCRSSGTLTSATGWMDEVRSPDDPSFRQLISDMTFSLFPAHRSENDFDSCSGTDC